ncbi:hypothetical protein TSMEX_001609 [Taenia solium]|eukprot:TsM_000982200 transcript=TsM_000982200 gene=TsM_000982200
MVTSITTGMRLITEGLIRGAFAVDLYVTVSSHCVTVLIVVLSCGSYCCADAALQLVMPTGLLMSDLRLHAFGLGPCVDCKI